MAIYFISILLLAASQHKLVEAQSIFINQVSGYSQLPPCAEVPLSIIVRDMASGCGDNGHTTSYSCFCSESSAIFNSDISTAVASTCSTTATAAVGQALQVFDNYCGVAPGGTNNATTTGESPQITQSTASVAATTYSAVRKTTAPIPSDTSGSELRTVPRSILHMLIPLLAMLLI